jgi:hypothetical protein
VALGGGVFYPLPSEFSGYYALGDRATLDSRLLVHNITISAKCFEVSETLPDGSVIMVLLAQFGKPEYSFVSVIYSDHEPTGCNEQNRLTDRLTAPFRMTCSGEGGFLDPVDPSGGGGGGESGDTIYCYFWDYYDEYGYLMYSTVAWCYHAQN